MIKMEIKETKFDEHGWKIVIKKSKDGTVTIAQRSINSSIHMMHKPMELRLRKEEFERLKELLKDEDN